MAIDFRMLQGELQYVYETAHARMNAHPEYTEKQKKILDKYNFLKSEDEVFEKAKLAIKNGSFNCQVWANIEKDEEYYYCANKWVVTDDYDILLAAEYIGFAQIPIHEFIEWFELNKQIKG